MKLNLKQTIYANVKPHGELIIVRQWKLKWYEHITRSDRQANTIVQATISRGRKKDRQEKRDRKITPECRQGWMQRASLL